ncbi:hypothetical protein C8J57DRAFT_1243937 [Mycena rebaudengoi]|nr:hypothetical protein C8J57DRAFT_1247782 [Mycena rebaudengoi]KAJ7242730.1 hypothetical protein C8J57DRAFT_1243937 [Mycena rebaudengoi]
MSAHHGILDNDCTYTCLIRLRRFLIVVAGSGNKRKLRWWLTVPKVCLRLFLRSVGQKLCLPGDFSNADSGESHGLHEISFLPLAATQAGADSMTAISLCFVLFNHRTGFRRTNSLLHTLMLYAINRSILTAAAAMVALLMESTSLLAGHQTGQHDVHRPRLVISGLYTNALMATLSSRHRISTESGDSGIIEFNSVHLSTLTPKASELREGNPTRPMLD